MPRDSRDDIKRRHQAGIRATEGPEKLPKDGPMGGEPVEDVSGDEGTKRHPGTPGPRNVVDRTPNPPQDDR